MCEAALPPAGWLPVNHRALSRLLVDVRRRADAGEAVACALDWDNTCIQGDIGDHVFQTQLAAGAFAVDAQEAGRRLARWPIVPSGVTSDVVAAWRACAAAAARPGAPAGWPAAAPAAHADLSARLAWAVQAVLAGAGAAMGEAFLWQAAWLDGLPAATVRALVDEAWAAGLASPPATRTWQSATAGRGGPRAARWLWGLRRCRQMEALVAALAAAGAEVFIVTASHQDVVAHLADKLAPELDGALAAARVVGMRPGVAGAPVTWRAGKVAAVARHLPAPPVLCAGDAETDYEMLTTYAPPGLALVIHRDLPAPMDGLYARAQREAAAGDAGGPPPSVLLQGRDEATGDLLASPWRRAAAPAGEGEVSHALGPPLRRP